MSDPTIAYKWPLKVTPRRREEILLVLLVGLVKINRFAMAHIKILILDPQTYIADTSR